MKTYNIDTGSKTTRSRAMDKTCISFI